ncbi:MULTISPECIES: hypothetical protein [Desulfitobacterium]|nr:MULTISPECIES: hypothetical protein [Desulfitobacterium]
MNNSGIKKEKDEKIFIRVSQQKMKLFTVIISFFFVWKVYWSAFNLISPQDTIMDVLALFGVLIIVIPCTAILQAKLLDFLKE